MISTPIRLTIVGKQSEPDSPPQEITLKTEGKLYLQREPKIIAYRETEQSGLGQTLTTVQIHRDGHIELLRTGESRTKMSFRTAERHQTQIHTPVGLMSIGLLTHEAGAQLREDDGEVTIRYALDYSNQSPVDMSLKLTYIKMEDAHDIQ